MEEKEKNPAVTEEEDEILDPDDFEDDDEEETEEEENKSETQEGASEEETEEEKEEKAKNAKAAERRRRQEAREKARKNRESREAKIREEAALDAKLGILKVNPYTEEPINDAEDLKIYEMQKELDEEGKDPINDLPKRIAERNRLAAKTAKEEEERRTAEETERQNKINAEIKELRTKYPKVNTAELAKDTLFQECLKGRAGRWSQVEIYEYYLTKKAEADKKVEEEKSRETVEKVADKTTTTPSSNAKGNSPQKEIDEMTPEEFEHYFAEKYNS